MIADDIKYLALAELGYEKEPDFDDDGDNAVNAVNLQYEHLYDLALTSFEWNFCSAFDVLDGVPTDNKRYAYKFELPEDLLFLRGQYTDDCGSYLYDYYNDGKYIYANVPTVYIRFTKKVNEELLPPYFVEYFKYKIAAKLCQTLTGDTDLLKLLISQEEITFASAKNADINQRPVAFLPTSEFIKVRF